MDTLYKIIARELMPYELGICSIGDSLLLINNTDQKVGRNIPDRDRMIDSIAVPFRMEQFGIIFCTEGFLHYSINLNDLTIHAGDVLLIAPNTIGTISGFDPQTHVMCIAIGTGFTPSDAGIKDYMSLYQMIISQPLLHLNEQQQSRFIRLFSDMQEAMNEPQQSLRENLSLAYLHVLFTYLQTYMQDAQKQQNNVREPRKMLILRQFLSLVEQHFREQRMLGFYANKLCVSAKHLGEVIREASGKNATDWIQERVIMEAKVLLLDGHHNVQQVSYQLNFPTQSFFGKYFKNAVGVSPSEYTATHNKAYR